MTPSRVDERASLARVLAASLAVTMAGTLPVFLTGSLAVEMAPDFGWKAENLGQALSAFFIVSALGSLSLGGVADSLGWRNGMRLGVLASLAAMVGVAASNGSKIVFVASLGVGGLAMAVGNPAVNLALSSEVPAHRQGLIFGVKHAAVPGAALLSGLALPVFALNFGWRWVYVGASLLVLLLIVAVPPESPSARASRPIGRSAASLDIAPLVFMAIAAALAAWVASALSAFLVSSLVDTGFSSGVGGLVLALASVAGLTTRVVAGWWADRRDGGLGGVAFLLAVGCVGLGMLTLGQRPLAVVGSVLAFGAGWGWNGLFNFAVVRNYPEAPARATSIALTGTYIGAALGPYFTGLVADRFSYSSAWVLTGVFSACAAAAILVARNRLRRRASRAAVTAPSEVGGG